MPWSQSDTFLLLMPFFAHPNVQTRNDSEIFLLRSVFLPLEGKTVFYGFLCPLCIKRRMNSQ